MRSVRIAETVMLGYPIERVDSYDGVGLLLNTSYEVLCTETGTVLASLPTLHSAQNYVLSRELDLATKGSAPRQASSIKHSTA